MDLALQQVPPQPVPGDMPTPHSPGGPTIPITDPSQEPLPPIVDPDVIDPMPAPDMPAPMVA